MLEFLTTPLATTVYVKELVLLGPSPPDQKQENCYVPNKHGNKKNVTFAEYICIIELKSRLPSSVAVI